MKKSINNYNKKYNIIIEDSEKYSDDEIKLTLKNVIKELHKKEINDSKILDVPTYYPEDVVEITYNDKIKGGKKPLTSSMFETSLKERNNDDGLAFESNYEDIFKSIMHDINNAKHLVSGKSESDRQALIDDYTKIENILRQYKENKKANELHKLIDRLSEYLNLNKYKKPTEFEKIQYSEKSRIMHQFDSNINHKYKPKFLCTPDALKESYIDAKNNKSPKIFEANLKKVEKDIYADLERINNGMDDYAENVITIPLLPEIINHYETAAQYARELGYNDYADLFFDCVDTLKDVWGLKEQTEELSENK